jgi:uncharacterized MnhB-related membrane protein
MGDGFFELIIVVILFLSSIPFIFQFKYGSRALWGWTKLPFWKICSISFIGQFLIAILIFTPFYIINPKDGYVCVFISILFGVAF